AKPVDEQILHNREHLLQWCQALEKQLNAVDAISRRYVVRIYEDPESQPRGIELIRLIHGLSETRRVPIEFFHTTDYAKLRDLGIKLAGLIQP
ncbi:MAG: DNA gyrase subunit B, partial [Bacteroidia bacterium]|nr:DNA gyrase subunit B [Bacteroidia bacterium]